MPCSSRVAKPPKPLPHEPTRMIPAANPSEKNPRPLRPPAAAALAFALLAGAILALSSIGGCSKAPARPTDDISTGPGEKVDQWKAAAAKLRKDTDAATIKSALGALGGEKLPATSDEALAA